MSKRKFRQSTHRKNEERKQQKGQVQQQNQAMQEPEHGMFIYRYYLWFIDTLIYCVSPLDQSLGEARTLDISQAECNILQNSVMQSDTSVPEPLLELSRTESPHLIQTPSSDHPPISASPPDDDSLQSVSSVLETVIRLNPLPSPWMTISAEPIVLCKMKVHPYKQVEIELTIRISDDMKWTLFVRNCQVDSRICPLLGSLPIHLENMESILHVIQKLGDCNLCVGNQDEKFIELHKQRAVTLHGMSGKKLNGKCSLLFMQYHFDRPKY